MGHTQMILLVLAITLLSTLLLTVYNTLGDQLDMSQSSAYRNQAMRIADMWFQKIQNECMVDKVPFSTLTTTYGTVNQTVVVNRVSYAVNVRTQYCNAAGGTTSPTTDFVRVDVRITANVAGLPTIYVGTTNQPLYKILTKKGV